MLTSDKQIMWNNLPFDILANIFSYLPPESFARAKSACRNWNVAAANTSFLPRHHPPWFVPFPLRSRGISCYVHNPVRDNWHLLQVDHVTCPIRPIATFKGLVLVKVTSTTSLQLAICNPFTKQFKSLPMLNVARTNPAVGLVSCETKNDVTNSAYKIYVAGGMTKVDSGGASYQSTIEMYDSYCDTWQVVGAMPNEFAVRLTVWTPNECVYANGILYWMTSARAYSVMGYEIETSKWRELSVPMADRLEFAALVPRKGKLALIGGLCNEGAYIWELDEENGVWNVIENVPLELIKRLVVDGKANWGCIKCVGIDGAIGLYIDLGSGLIVRKEVVDEGKCEWLWIEGCCPTREKHIQNLPVKGLLLHPNLACHNF